ncbi:hypothetical protein Acry_2673 [Acidiphilium cryptum JF-5]|uniref:Uncharacterized protein n=1 Tax=Acidiphilium cryptum (strain JF-5) TaxID=349163 RepID=A5G1Y2_ACICJ|nr:hypothetical protein Acry_2673 [Acidiphilium cryptum JF-5]
MSKARCGFRFIRFLSVIIFPLLCRRQIPYIWRITVFLLNFRYIDKSIMQLSRHLEESSDLQRHVFILLFGF